MTAAEIAAELGGAHRSGAWWRCRCTVHSSRGATLALRDGNRGGLIVKCFAGCEPRDVLAELRRRGLIGSGYAHRPESVTVQRPSGDDAAGRIEAALWVWNAARSARGTRVEDCLAGRGITTALPPSLRCAPTLRRLDGTRGPAMVARIDDIDGKLIGIQRTWLDRGSDGQWRRLDRAMLGRAAGGAVRLASAGELLMISEGVETALSAMQATGLPAWAALSTSGLTALVLPPLPLAATVIILADNDRNGAGERAARAAAARWLVEGRRVRIAMPPEPGTDFNDVLLGRDYAQVRDVAA